VRSARDGAGAAPGASIPSGAGWEQPHVLSAWRGGGSPRRGRSRTAYILSTLSGCRLEDVKAASTGPVWYQLYLVGGREVASAAIERARTAGYSALAVTIDTAVSGLRERDVRNGTKELLGAGLTSKLPFLGQFLARPRWLAGFLSDGGLMSFPNVVLPGRGPMPYADVAAALEQSTVAWADLDWIREVWKGPIVIKGVLTGDDARRAVDEGAVAMVVSNHGGRAAVPRCCSMVGSAGAPTW
jgi:L-lactate dehydrogenase (cytochrome)